MCALLWRDYPTEAWKVEILSKTIQGADQYPDVLDFGRTEILGVDTDDDSLCFGVDAYLLHATSLPSSLHQFLQSKIIASNVRLLNGDIDGSKGFFDKLSHRVHLARRKDKVLGLILLQDAPHALCICEVSKYLQSRGDHVTYQHSHVLYGNDKFMNDWSSNRQKGSPWPQSRLASRLPRYRQL